MPLHNKTKCYHFFHSGLEHHNQHMLGLFKCETYQDYQNVIVSTDPHGSVSQVESYDVSLTSLKVYIQFIRRKVTKNDVIIIHGLYTNWHYLIPLIAPRLAKRVVWDIWGDDFFSAKRLKISSDIKDKIRYLIRRYAVPKFGAIAGFSGDVEELKAHFNFKNKVFNINHPLRANIDELSLVPQAEVKVKKLLIGNSGSRSNEHIRALEQLRCLANFNNLELYCIFSTDVDQAYYQELQVYLAKYQIENITIIEEMMEFDEFIAFVNSIDVVLLPHRRQQGVGTANLSLILGKPVFMDNTISTVEYYNNHGITVFDVTKLVQLNDFKLDTSITIKNSNKIKQLFGRKSVKVSWEKITAELLRE